MKNLNNLYKITITNSLLKKKEQLLLDSNRDTTMYVCGITPYDYAHIGHGRCYVTFDTLFRLLKTLDYNVKYCRNFTDIDDKILNKAQKVYGSSKFYNKISQEYINAYLEDMQLLNCLNPTTQPKVTESIDLIIDFIKKLIESKKAYIKNNDVYFDISSFTEYGKLSKRNLADLLSGARVEVREEKRNPLDFALWKNAPQEEPGWNSPWGHGRPGWHIECSAMANRYLGKSIDIHGGGMDLIFPHHENEIAQSESINNCQFAKYWIHNAFVRINEEKMSKSLNNFVTLKDVFKVVNPMELRYYYLNQHYKNPLDFSIDDIENFAKSYHKICLLFKDITEYQFTAEDIKNMPILNSLLLALCDDLNISKFFGILFDNYKTIQSSNDKQTQAIKWLIINTLGLTLELKEKVVSITPEIESLINEREEARKNKNWAKADKLREKLQSLGFNVQDYKA